MFATVCVRISVSACLVLHFSPSQMLGQKFIFLLFDMKGVSL